MGSGADLVLASYSLCTYYCRHLLWVSRPILDSHTNTPFWRPLLLSALSNYYLYRHIMPSRWMSCRVTCRRAEHWLTLLALLRLHLGQLHSPCFTAHRVGLAVPHTPYCRAPCCVVLHEPFVLVWC